VQPSHSAGGQDLPDLLVRRLIPVQQPANGNQPHLSRSEGGLPRSAPVREKALEDG
jgi:hypothetical protein